MEEKIYYVYMYSICGVEFMMKGTLEECEAFKAKHDAVRKPGDLWRVEIKDHKVQEMDYWSND